MPADTPSFRTRYWLAVSLPVFLLEGFTLLMLNLDVVLLKLYVAPEQIGIYFAAARTISLIAFVHFAVTAVAMARFSAAFANGDVPAVQRLMAQARNWTFWPSLAGAAALLALGKPLLWLFGPEFTAGYPVMFVLVLGLLAKAAAGPAQGLLVVTGRQNAAAVILAFSVMLNLALNLLLIPRFGLMGAAAATAAAFALEAAALAVVAHRSLTASPLKEVAQGAPAE